MTANEIERAVVEVCHRLEQKGARMTIVLPGMEPQTLGDDPGRCRVRFHTREAAEGIVRGDLLALAQAYLAGGIDIEGEMIEAARINEALRDRPGVRDRARLWANLLSPGRRRFNRFGVSFHYDRPAEFFLPWLDRWRSYSHGFYTSPEDDPSEAQARKMQYAIDALGLEPGMRVFDMGGGWGCFSEYAGRQGIRVHSITISREQHRFLTRLIEERGLPCSVELVDFLDYRPSEPFDAGVFLGTFEHVPDYWRIARFLAANLRPGARFYADFSASRGSGVMWGFLRRYIWDGAIAFVNVQRMVTAFQREGFNLHALGDDTLSYAYTVRDWARAMEADRDKVVAASDEATVRAFLIWLWASYLSLLANRTQAYHVVGGLDPAPLRSR